MFLPKDLDEFIRRPAEEGKDRYEAIIFNRSRSK